MRSPCAEVAWRVAARAGALKRKDAVAVLQPSVRALLEKR
jgi:hypothetical protein